MGTNYAIAAKSRLNRTVQPALSLRPLLVRASDDARDPAKPMKILLVEDDRLLSQQIADALRDENFAVDIAANGEDGQHLGETEAYDAAVLDLGLPKVPGAVVLRAWRQGRPAPAGAHPDRARRLERKGRGLQGRRRRLSDKAVPDRGADHAAARAGAARGRPCRAAHRLRRARLRRADRRVRARRPAAQADGARMARARVPDPAQGRGGRPHGARREGLRRRRRRRFQFARGDRRPAAPQDRRATRSRPCAAAAIGWPAAPRDVASPSPSAHDCWPAPRCSSPWRCWSRASPSASCCITSSSGRSTSASIRRSCSSPRCCAPTRTARLSLSGNADGPPFDRPGRGWYWQVSGPGNTLRARALGGETLDVSALPAPPPPPLPPAEDRVRAGPPPRPADGPGPDGDSSALPHQARSGRRRARRDRGRRAARRRARAAGAMRSPCSASASPCSKARCSLAMLLQVRLGLRPLARLRDAVADVRAGRSERLPADQPSRDAAAGRAR